MDGNDGGTEYFEPGVAGIRLRGDELDRYIEFHEELYRTIRHLVFSTPETAADACSFAWLQFLRYQPPRDGNWKGWMVTTAQREAWRLTAIEWRDRDLSEAEVKGALPIDPRDRFAERVAFDAALQQLKKLPLALHRVVLIRSQVWNKEVVAEVMGIQPDQVDELLRHAAVQLAEVDVDRHDRERPVASPRAARLRELEDDAPEWLSNVIGHCPHRSKSAAGVILAWRRAALAIDDYRGVTDYANPQKRSASCRRQLNSEGHTSTRNGRSFAWPKSVTADAGSSARVETIR